jgi:peptidoglycan-associated lipoprotein
MRTTFRSMLMTVAVLPLFAACATKGQLRTAVEQQRTALTTERNERFATDSALRQDLATTRGDLEAVKADVQGLHSELTKMRADFGAKIAVVEQGLQFALPVNFAYDDAQVRVQDYPALERFARVVERYYPASKVTVEGFADPAGSVRYNLQLSERRAEAVKSFLASRGLSDSQVAAIGYGKTRLVVPNAAREQAGAEQNRRVVFVIESNGQQPMPVASASPDAR